MQRSAVLVVECREHFAERKLFTASETSWFPFTPSLDTSDFTRHPLLIPSERVKHSSLPNRDLPSTFLYKTTFFTGTLPGADLRPDVRIPRGDLKESRGCRACFSGRGEADSDMEGGLGDLC